MDHPEEQLVFILSPAPKWGNYVVYPARVADKGEYYLYLGRYGEEDMAALPDAGRSLARLCMQYELPRLYDRFGKNKYRTEQLFADKADGKELKEIRSFVDATVHGVVCSLLEEGYPLFLKEKRWENPYKKDRISLSGEVLKPLSSFHRDDTHVRYVLRLDCHGKMLYPEEAGLRIVTEQPGMVLRGHRLYRLPEGFSGMRIRPFLHKKEIIIPRASEAVYFRTFILKSVSNEDIEVEGFDIIEPPVQKQMVVWLEQNLLGKPILSVKARYNGHELSLPCDKPSIVELKEEEGGYRFYRISRDFAWEKERLAQLESLGMLREAGGWFRLKDGKGWEDMVAWAGAHRADLAESGILFSQERLRHPFYTGGHRLSYARGESMTDWFQVKAEIVLDDGYTFSLHDLWENILSGQREYLLKNGKVFLIPEEWFARYSGLFLFARQERDGSFLLRNLQSPLLEEGILSAPGHDYEPVLEPVAVPVSLKADLRGYQLKGYRWLHALYRQSAGACLADDMGLGKTVQAIALLLAYKEERPRLAKETVGASLQLDLFATAEEGDGLCRYTCLIIAPASVEHNWRNELRKFAPSLMVGSYVGMQRSRKRQALMCWDVVTTTYHTLRNDIDFLARQHFGFLVFDEAQCFKNRDSRLYQAVKSLRADYRIALTGTPIENSLGDLWSLMDVLNPGVLGSYRSFQKNFLRPIQSAFDELHLSILNRLVKPYILRRTKEEVLQDLPERTDELVYCDMTAEQKKIYEEELSMARNRLLEQSLSQDVPGRMFNALQALGRLRQLANHPRLLRNDYSGGSGKLDEVFRMLETLKENGHKVLLFSDYVKLLDLVAEEMDRRGWKYAELEGTTKDRERQIALFSDDRDCLFFLISLKAGGVGINLTEADYVFILDPWWNPAAEEQAISRAHRIGQKRAVFVYRFVSSGTLEERILDMQQRKARLAGAVITVGDGHLPMDVAELENLI